MSEPCGERTFSIEEVAEHCGLPQSVLRQWLDNGLLEPLRGTGARFGFQAVGLARTLCELRRAGWSPARIKARWAQARRVVADPAAALSGLVASVGAGHVTVRAPDGRLLEPSGQMLFDFKAGSQASGANLPRLRSPRDWFAIGVEAEAAGRVQDAARAYEHALPDCSAETHFNLGNCYYEQKRRKEAAAQFLAAIRCNSAYAEAWNNLGIVRGELGDRRGAVQALEHALSLVPHYADAHYNLAEALSSIGELGRARRHWSAYLRFDPNSRWAEQARRRLRSPRG